MTQPTLRKIHGCIGQIRPVQGGFIIRLAERFPGVRKSTWHSIAIFGAQAQAISQKQTPERGPALRIGQFFTFAVTESTVTRNGRTYHNLRAIHWCFHPPQGVRYSDTPNTKAFDTDWFVPSTRPARNSPYQRRHEGFQGAGR